MKVEVIDEIYEVKEKIAEGGAGIIYKAYHKRLEKMVIIKETKEELTQKINIRAEADILKSLKHMYLPTVYDFIEENNHIYTIMEYIEGKNLENLSKEQTNFSEYQIIKWSKQLCEVLIYLQKRERPIIHSDIKPANIIITPEDNICLIDFNISIILNEGLSALGHTTGYSAPEQYVNKAEKRSDIYSLGAVMYYLITKETPNQIKSIYSFKIKVNRRLKAIIYKAMEQQPEKRFKDAQEMFNSLNNLDRHNILAKYKLIFLELVVAVLISGKFLKNQDCLINNNKDYYLNCIECLNSLEREEKLTQELLQARAENYYKLAVITNKKEYILKSAMDFEKLLEMKYINFYNISQAASLYEKAEKFNKAEEILKENVEKVKDYRLYVQLAFIYAKQEDKKDKIYRDYSKVKENYEMAVKYYGLSEDKKLEELKKLIKDLEEKEWI